MNPKAIKKLVRYTPHQQYFCEDGSEVVGASTIAGIGKAVDPLLGWVHKLNQQGKDYRVERDLAKDIGTVTHFLTQCALEGCEADVSAYEGQVVEQALIPHEIFMNWWGEQDFTCLDPELQLVSEIYRYGGTIDVPFRNSEGELGLLDLKTSDRVYDEHKFQLSAYEMLMVEHYHEEVFHRAVVQIGRDGSRTNLSHRSLWLGDMSKYFEVFKAQLNLYNAKKAL
jgi:hypothetical protein